MCKEHQEQPKLKSCWQCGSENVVIWIVVTGVSFLNCAGCEHCEMFGALASTEEDAIEAWNSKRSGDRIQCLS
jgi:transcription elongation factor Elf1